MSEAYLVGCDVGTSSARIGIFMMAGEMVAIHTYPIEIWRPQPGFVEQSSENIWTACCIAVKEAIEKAKINSEQIKGIGFDATCSLVVLGENDGPVTVSPSGADHQNVIVWMDHRSIKEAGEINKMGHEILKFLGGKISPEMETPKLLWLKRNKPDTWSRATRFFDLPDFLVYRATGVDVRSVCTTTCKWTYKAHEELARNGRSGMWDDSYFREIGLSDIVEDNYQRIGQNIRAVGSPVGTGLTKTATEQMGLVENTPVGISIIDAHAGGLGLLEMVINESDRSEPSFEDRIALIRGTSSYHLAVSRTPRFIDGVWGPYYSGMIPGMWLNEGGQSATGALIDHVIFSSKQSVKLEEQAVKEETTVYELLNARLYQLAEEQNVQHVGMLTRDLHVLPYFHGNRSPRADPSLLGSICGLQLSDTLDDLALLYMATIQAVAYGTRHIIDTMNENGYSISQIMATGGGTKNELFLQEHADISGCRIMLPKETEAVLLGSAVLGAVASGAYSSIYQAMVNMNNIGRTIAPTGGNLRTIMPPNMRFFTRCTTMRSPTLK